MSAGANSAKLVQPWALLVRFRLCVSDLFVSDLEKMLDKAILCCADRLPWKTTRRTLILGLIMGSSLKMLSWGREQLQEQATVLSENAAQGTIESINKGLSEDKKR